MKTTINGNLDRIFNRPTSCQSSMKRIDINSGAIAPVFHAQSFSFVCQHHIAASVAVLLVASSPPAITRLVISTLVRITINAVQERWSLTHILQERLKRIAPPIAHLNALRAIPLIVFIRAVVASRQHRHPRTVCKRGGFTVRDWTDAVQVISKAAAACTAFAAKTSTEYSAQSATVAPAVPHGAALLIQPSIGENGPSPKDFSCQIFNAGRDRDRIGFSHERSPETGLVRAAGQRQLLGRLHFNRMFSSGAMCTCSSF